MTAPNDRIREALATPHWSENVEVRNALAEALNTVRGFVDTYDVDAFVGVLMRREMKVVADD